MDVNEIVLVGYLDSLLKTAMAAPTPPAWVKALARKKYEGPGLSPTGITGASAKTMKAPKQTVSLTAKPDKALTAGKEVKAMCKESELLSKLASCIKAADKKELNADEKDIAKFVRSTPFPDDDQMHAHVESKGKDPHKVEPAAYSLATLAAKLLDTSYNKKPVRPAELAKGKEVEKEHTDDTVVAQQIAKDHLQELPDYYTRLGKMEDEGKESKTKKEKYR